MFSKLWEELYSSATGDFESWENTDSLDLPFTPETKQKSEELKNNIEELNTNRESVKDSVETARRMVEDSKGIKITEKTVITPAMESEFERIWKKNHPDK